MLVGPLMVRLRLLDYVSQLQPVGPTWLRLRTMILGWFADPPVGSSLLMPLLGRDLAYRLIYDPIRVVWVYFLFDASSFLSALGFLLCACVRPHARAHVSV